MKTLKKLKLVLIAIFSLTLTTVYSHNDNVIENNLSVVINELPKKLIGTYEGTLTKLGGGTMVNPEATCTIKTAGNNKYNLHFSDGVKSINNVKFNQADDVFTATSLYNGKKLAISLDLEGSISIGSTSVFGTIAFTGDLIGYNNKSGRDKEVHTTKRETTVIKSDNQSIHTNRSGTNIKNGNQSINTQGGNVSLSTGNMGINTSNKSTNIRTGRRGGSGRANAFYECNSDEVAELPEEVIGIYTGRLNAPGVDTARGICKIVKTGCKTYRLDFSNRVPSIYGVQFGKMDKFEDFESVIIEGEYATDIEVDMRFDDLTIKKGVLNITFKGDK